MKTSEQSIRWAEGKFEPIEKVEANKILGLEVTLDLRAENINIAKSQIENMSDKEKVAYMTGLRDILKEDFNSTFDALKEDLLNKKEN